MKADVSHFFGRTVEKVKVGDEDWKWTIILEGSVRISNLDGRRVAIPDVVGLALENAAADGTSLEFSGGQQIGITPGQMRLSAPGADDPDVDEPTAESSCPVDPSLERVVSGPIGPTDHPGGGGPGPVGPGPTRGVENEDN